MIPFSGVGEQLYSPSGLAFVCDYNIFFIGNFQ